MRTTDVDEAEKLLRVLNEAAQPSNLNGALGEAYLDASDERLATRTWRQAMDELSSHGRESSQKRCRREMASKPFTSIRNKVIAQTNAEDFHEVLKNGGSSTNNYLRRLHNLALGMGWLSRPIIPPKLWPKMTPKPKRGITLKEHQATCEPVTSTPTPDGSTVWIRGRGTAQTHHPSTLCVHTPTHLPGMSRWPGCRRRPRLHYAMTALRPIF